MYNKNKDLSGLSATVNLIQTVNNNLFSHTPVAKCDAKNLQTHCGRNKPSFEDL